MHESGRQRKNGLVMDHIKVLHHLHDLSIHHNNSSQSNSDEKVGASSSALSLSLLLQNHEIQWTIFDRATQSALDGISLISLILDQQQQQQLDHEPSVSFSPQLVDARVLEGVIDRFLIQDRAGRDVHSTLENISTFLKSLSTAGFLHTTTRSQLTSLIWQLDLNRHSKTFSQDLRCLFSLICQSYTHSSTSSHSSSRSSDKGPSHSTLLSRLYSLVLSNDGPSDVALQILDYRPSPKFLFELLSATLSAPLTPFTSSLAFECFKRLPVRQQLDKLTWQPVLKRALSGKDGANLGGQVVCYLRELGVSDLDTTPSSESNNAKKSNQKESEVDAAMEDLVRQDQGLFDLRS